MKDKKDLKSIRLTIRLNQKEENQLQKLVEHFGINKSAILTMALKQLADRNLDK